MLVVIIHESSLEVIVAVIAAIVDLAVAASPELSWDDAPAGPGVTVWSM